MNAPENKASITIDLLENYNILNGDKIIIKEITGSYAWALQAIGENITGADHIHIEMKGSNDLGDGSINNFNSFPTSQIIDLGVASKIADSVQDFYLSYKYIAIEIKKDAGITGGIISSLKLVLNRTL